MPGKTDLKKTLDCYRAGAALRVVEVPDLRYLMVDGHGDPNTSTEYTEALKALYPLAYAIKAASKQELGRDYVVPPLEGLWWSDDMAAFTSRRNKSQWDWTMMLMVPEWISEQTYEAALRKVTSKSADARLQDVRRETLSEGLCVQVLHHGAYDDEAAVLDRMHNEFIPKNGLTMTGKHHEIYLSDPRRTAAEKLRTILRQPVTRAPASGTDW